jgi:hypothetical protein
VIGTTLAIAFSAVTSDVTGNVRASSKGRDAVVPGGNTVTFSFIWREIFGGFWQVLSNSAV